MMSEFLKLLEICAAKGKVERACLYADDTFSIDVKTEDGTVYTYTAFTTKKEEKADA